MTDLSTRAAREQFRWPISATARIHVPAAELWRVISSPDSLLPSHPFLSANPIERWEEAASRDEVHYLRGLVYRREFRQWYEGSGFDLEILHRLRAISWVSWRVAPHDSDAANLRITVYPYVLQNKPAPVRLAGHLLILRPRLRAYLSSVTRGYKWYAEKNEAVPRNQFGEHPWFS